MLGVLLHDVGKAHGEPHSETGVPVARGIVERLGYGPRTVDLVATLVRHHLLLPDVATRRDLAEPGLAASVAETVGDGQTLAALHLLAAADGTATGPTAWTHWKATLVRQLVQKVRTVLDTSHPDVIADTAERTAVEAQQLAPGLGVPEDVIREHLTLLPVRYAAAVTPRAAIRHAGMAATTPDATEIRTRVTPGPEEAGYDELDVVARDRAGLFALVVGVLAIHEGSVLGAHAFTRRDGIAVDTLTVACPRDDRSSWWAAVEGDLAEAAAGRVALRARIDEKAAKQLARARPTPDVEMRVEVYPDESGRTTVVEVHAPDRPGLLFRIASAFAELTLDIVVARITTLGPQAVDVFGVRDAAGEPLDDDHAVELTLALRGAIDD
jgi:[protein-PII] uridylyltransferase